MILAAGRGERLRPLTDHTPKPLLRVGGRRLIEYHLHALSRAGVREVVVNTAWLGDAFEPALGDASAYGLRLRWSHEPRAPGAALETAGGIATALPQLASAFWVVSGDVLLPQFAFDAETFGRFVEGPMLAQLWLVPNAPHHPQGDFAIDDAGRAVREGADKRTWASVGLFKAEMFRDMAPMTAAEAAGVILDGVREERWRILVGADAARLDALVRQYPEEAYTPGFTERLREEGTFDFR